MLRILVFNVYLFLRPRHLLYRIVIKNVKLRRFTAKIQNSKIKQRLLNRGTGRVPFEKKKIKKYPESLDLCTSETSPGECLKKKKIVFAQNSFVAQHTVYNIITIPRGAGGVSPIMFYLISSSSSGSGVIFFSFRFLGVFVRVSRRHPAPRVFKQTYLYARVYAQCLFPLSLSQK